MDRSSIIEDDRDGNRNRHRNRISDLPLLVSYES